MGIYYFLGFITFLFAVWEGSKEGYQHKKILYVSFGVFLVLLIGLRDYDFGRDTGNYYSAFDTIDTNMPFYFYGYETHLMEPGYLWLNWLIKKIGFDFWMVLLFTAFISIYIKMKTFFKLSPSFFPAICFYLAYNLHFYEMMVLRQCVAIAFCFAAFPYALQRSFKKYFIYWLIGFGLHYSTLLFFPVYWLVKWDFGKPRVLFIAVLLMVFNISTFFLIIKLLPYLPAKFYIYLSRSTSFSLAGIAKGQIIFFLFAIVFLAYKKRVSHPIYNAVFSIYVIGLGSNFFLSGLSRASHVYITFSCILWGYIVSYHRPMYRAIIMLFLVAFYCFKTYISDSSISAFSKPGELHYRSSIHRILDGL